LPTWRAPLISTTRVSANAASTCAAAWRGIRCGVGTHHDSQGSFDLRGSPLSICGTCRVRNAGHRCSICGPPAWSTKELQEVGPAGLPPDGAASGINASDGSGSGRSGRGSIMTRGRVTISGLHSTGCTIDPLPCPFSSRAWLVAARVCSVRPQWRSKSVGNVRD
jgi:hypothetical protein